jgi:multidrug resistance efflux pump
MSTTIPTALRSSLAALLGAAYLLIAVGHTCADPPTATQTPEASKQEQSAVPETAESLDVRYARAHLELAKLDLRRAEYWNKQAPGVITERTLDYLRQHIRVDEAMLRHALNPASVDVHEIYVENAKVLSRLADDDVARKTKMYKEVGSEHLALELDRAIAWSNAAKINLERTTNERDSTDTIANLQWQIEELRNQILEVSIKFESFSRE